MRFKMALLILAAGCASDPPPCDFSSHTYLRTSRELSGDCGPVPDFVDDPSAGDVTMTGCTGGPIPAEGACAMGSHQICPTGTGYTTETVIAVHRTDDDSTYEGTADLKLYDMQSTLLCHSVYAVTFTPK